MSRTNALTRYPNKPGNHSGLFNNEKFVQLLITSVRGKLQRQLLSTEKSLIFSFLQDIDPVIFTGKSYGDIKDSLVDAIVAKINTLLCDNPNLDIHEMMKEQIGVSRESTGGAFPTDTTLISGITGTAPDKVEITSLLGARNLVDIVALMGPRSSIKSTYLLLDSRYRVLANDGRSYFQWNFINNTTRQQGSVNSYYDVQNIIAIRTFPFKVPYLAALDNLYKKVTLYFTELSSQSVIAQENRSYHFIYDSVIDGRFINLNPGGNVENGYYKFRQPISVLNTLTITFGSPLEEVLFDLDRMNMLVTDYAATTSFTTAPLQNHNLETGDIVYITNFTTANPTFDITIIGAVNNSNGVIATYISETVISIGVDTSSLAGTGVGTINVINNNVSVTGNGTVFLTFYKVGDIIQILGVKYIVATIPSDTTLTLTSVYIGTTANTLAYSKNNIIDNLVCNFYFGSKRIFLPIEIEYINVNSS